MDEILAKTHYRKTFFLSVTTIILLTLLIRKYVIPELDGSLDITYTTLLASLLDNLIISLFLAVAIGCFLFWLQPEIIRRSVIQVVEPKQINPLLKSATDSSCFWIYKGTCGRYTRATTIPRFAEAARNAGIGRDIRIFLLDPNDTGLCEEYATYRRSLKSARTGVPWTATSVQEEIIATALTALKFSQSEPLLRIEVYFVNNFSAFRLDISDVYAIITKEDKEASALRADAGSYFYDSYKDDVRLTERQARRMVLPAIMPDEINSATAIPLIIESQIANSAAISLLNAQHIVDKVNNPTDPYR